MGPPGDFRAFFAAFSGLGDSLAEPCVRPSISCRFSRVEDVADVAVESSYWRATNRRRARGRHTIINVGRLKLRIGAIRVVCRMDNKCLTTDF